MYILHAENLLTEKQLKGKDFSRSLYVVKDINEGEIITKENVKSIRPGFGMHPKYYNEILGKAVLTNLKSGTKLSFDQIQL